MLFLAARFFAAKTSSAPLENIANKVAVDVFVTLGLFSLLYLIWCAFTPKWIEKTIERVAGKLILILALILFGSLITVILPIFVQ